MFERAGVPRFFQATIESVQGGVEIIKKNETDERKGKITAALRQGVLQRGRVHETRDVIKHGGAEERFDSFQDEYGAIGARNAEVAPEKKPQLAEDANHKTRSPLDAAESWPVRRRKTSSSEEAPELSLSLEAVPPRSRRPASTTATRS